MLRFIEKNVKALEVGCCGLRIEGLGLGEGGNVVVKGGLWGERRDIGRRGGKGALRLLGCEKSVAGAAWGRVIRTFEEGKGRAWEGRFLGLVE